MYCPRTKLRPQVLEVIRRRLSIQYGMNFLTISKSTGCRRLWTPQSLPSERTWSIDHLLVTLYTEPLRRRNLDWGVSRVKDPMYNYVMAFLKNIQMFCSIRGKKNANKVCFSSMILNANYESRCYCKSPSSLSTKWLTFWSSGGVLAFLSDAEAAVLCGPTRIWATDNTQGVIGEVAKKWKQIGSSRNHVTILKCDSIGLYFETNCHPLKSFGCRI